MIHRLKQTKPPKGLLSDDCRIAKNDALIKKFAHIIQDKYYKDATKGSLLKLYENKCAFCETIRGTEIQIDHFRPKKPRLNIRNSKYNQPGYYWLCYEWTNLIPLCSKCNQIKSNKFPLIGWAETNRISDHSNKKRLAVFLPFSAKWLNDFETPLLIHPELELTPARHFEFDKKCKMIGRTKEGVETINVCELNRKDLLRNRKKRVGKCVKNINSALDDFEGHKSDERLKGELSGIFKSIKNDCKETEQFSLFNTFIYKYFDTYIVEKLPYQLRSKLLKYFSDFNSGTL